MAKNQFFFCLQKEKYKGVGDVPQQAKWAKNLQSKFGANVVSG